MHALSIERADGSRWKVTLRRLRPHDDADEPRGLERECELLRLLERVGISAPRPIYLDSAGEHFGAPASVLSFIPGKLNVAEKNTGPWTDALAATLLSIHAITLETTNLSILKRTDNRARIDDIASDVRDDSLANEVLEVLRAHCDRIEPLPDTLVHNDYWAGNTIWQRGRITGVIDWLHARVGDPRNDVSECRGALVFDHDEDVANEFLAAYERRLGRVLPDLWFFDLLRAIAAYLYYEFWLEGTRDLGIELDPGATGERLAAFLRHALDASKATA
jgi:aminoglycoside phosphotransferase (APT) family kinase protein